MKRLISIIMPLFLLQAAIGQEIKISHLDANYFQNTTNFELKDQLPDGIYKIYYDPLKTILDYSGTIINHKRDNLWVWFYEAGTKKREITYQNGLYQGQFISYYPNGQQSVNMSYSQGIQNGLAIRWYLNGNKKFEGSYLNGRPSGVWKFWKENGAVSKEEQH